MINLALQGVANGSYFSSEVATIRMYVIQGLTSKFIASFPSASASFGLVSSIPTLATGDVAFVESINGPGVTGAVSLQTIGVPNTAKPAFTPQGTLVTSVTGVNSVTLMAN